MERCVIATIHLPPTGQVTMIECSCGRRWVPRRGDGMTSPPRLYWHRVRRLHLRRYGSHA